ncbi:hypothetical protein FB45DRAFT_1063449 [Roridomyces roridus]|uniref:Uncharacterized protein n=1 Tax=Roridomyces roridus TaxID=1738132 RepID=A0AAD7BDE7_9AGAR|nr:hypothetical protein FB45DRAFT_1063449 [Roridomyces roridus]
MYNKFISSALLLLAFTHAAAAAADIVCGPTPPLIPCPSFAPCPPCASDEICCFTRGSTCIPADGSDGNCPKIG